MYESNQVAETPVAVPETTVAPNQAPATSPVETLTTTDITNTTSTEPIVSTTTSEQTQSVSENAVAFAEQPSEAAVLERASGDDVMNVDGDAPTQADAPKEEATPVVAAAVTDNSQMPDAQEPTKNASVAPAAQPYVTDALEAMLNGSMEVDTATQTQTEERPQEASAQDLPLVIQPTEATAEGPTDAAAEGEGVDWEVDSSPYESSSSDSDSSDDSDDDDDDADMLGVQETVRMMMESAMQDSDDDEEGGNRSGGNIRSKNEEPESAPPKPEVEIGSNDEVVLLGPILHIVENSAVIRGNTDGAYRVLDAGSVLCKADRTVVGAVADVIGNVRSPMYVLRFAQVSDLVKDGLEAGQDLYYPTKHASFVFTEELRNIKGSDASNLHDEEVGAEEAEFSDDEKEAAHKRELKARRRGGVAAGGNNDRNGAQGKRGQNNNRGAHPLRNEVTGGSSNAGLKYDDDEDDGPYKPLARPANFGQNNLPLVPPPSANANNSPNAGSHTGGGSFRGSQRFNRGGAGGSPGYGRGGNRGGGFRGRGGYDNIRGGRGGWNGGNRNNNDNSGNNNGQNNSNYSSPGTPQSSFNFNPAVPPPPPPQLQQNRQHQTPTAPWPFAGMPFPPPPPPPQSGGVPPPPQSTVNMATAAALLNNVQIQQLFQQHQQHQQQQQRQQQPPAAPPAWPGMRAAPPQQPSYQFQYQQSAYQPPQQQQQQQQTPAAPAFDAATTFQFLFQGGAQGQTPPPPPHWGQQPPPSS
jgi:H/ACA ribonucleoprotein complex non-core subunit NAF1